MLSNPEISKVLTVLEESAFSNEKLAGYEHFWNGISVEKTLYNSGERDEKAEEQRTIAKNLKEQGITPFCYRPICRFIGGRDKFVVGRFELSRSRAPTRDRRRTGRINVGAGSARP